MPLTVYALKTCDTCRKAIKALTPIHADLVVVDIREEADLAALVPEWLKTVDVETLVNKRSTTWRGLSADDQARVMTPAGATALLLEHPTLVKRPVIVEGSNIWVGWTKAVQSDLGIEG